MEKIYAKDLVVGNFYYDTEFAGKIKLQLIGKIEQGEFLLSFKYHGNITDIAYSSDEEGVINFSCFPESYWFQDDHIKTSEKVVNLEFEEIVNLEFEKVGDDKLFPNHTDKDIWVAGFKAGYEYTQKILLFEQI